jgi:hypothetical protein
MDSSLLKRKLLKVTDQETIGDQTLHNTITNAIDPAKDVFQEIAIFNKLGK